MEEANFTWLSFLNFSKHTQKNLLGWLIINNNYPTKTLKASLISKNYQTLKLTRSEKLVIEIGPNTFSILTGVE